MTDKPYGWNRVRIVFEVEDGAFPITPEALAHERKTQCLHGVATLLETIGLQPDDVLHVLSTAEQLEFIHRK